MPSKAKRIDRAVAKLPSIPKELVSQFLTGPMTGEAINAAGAAFKKALIEAALNAELSHHLGYEPGAEQPAGTTNHRNGVTAKAVLTGDGRLPIETPREGLSYRMGRHSVRCLPYRSTAKEPRSRPGNLVTAGRPKPSTALPFSSRSDRGGP
jgi:hypothetical protein